MNVNFVCQNAHSSASCLSSFRYKANKLTMPVLALLALLCGMTASAHAQIASYAGVTTPFPTGVTLTNVEGMGTDSIAGGNGNVFFAGYNGTTWGVYEMTRSTTTPATYGTATLLTSPTATYSYLRGVAIDKNGNLWFADNGNGTAGTSQLYWMQYNSTTKAFAAPQTVGTGWVALWGIATDTAGNVFVTDNGAATAPANSLFEVSAASIALAAPAATLIPNTTVTSPRGIAVDGSDDIFVIDGAYQVEGLTSATTYATATVINNTGFQGPGDLALDANGNLWLSEYSTNSARELTVGSGYATVYSWGSTTTINGPVAVWPDADGNILISDVNDGAINQINTQPPTFTTAVALGGSSSAPQTLTFSFPGSTTTTIGAPVIVGPDFVNAGTGTCTAAGSPYATLATCTVAVNFTPLSPGPRWGAVELVDGSGNVLAQELIYGSATGPEITYPSSGATALDSGHAFSSPQQIAVDAAGDVFIVENGSSAVSVIKGGVTSQPINGLNNPFGIAVDGAGNIFVAQAGSGKIAEFYAPLYATSRTLGASLDTPLGMAFDGSGNLYVTEAGGTNDVVKLSAVTDYGNRTVLSSSFTTPFAVAVDGSGNVWVADKGATSVTELSPAGAVTGTFGSFSSPEGIAVDPAGNVYVSDNGGSSISELTKATNFATTVTLASSTSTPAVATPVGVALDSHGNVYYANGDGTVDEINLTTAPTLAFGNEPYGTLSAPQSVILSNIGNADLNFTNIQTTTDYVNVGTGGDCVVGTPVTAGGSCPLAITFTPTSIGSDPGTATLTDVAIPNPQVISLSGSGTQATPTLSVTNSPVTYNGAPQAATVTGSVAGTVSNVLYNGSATVPTTAGTYPITANFTPSNPADYATLTAASAGSFVISKATPTLSITNTPAPYTGNPVAATVVGSVGGTVSAVLYGGSATVPTAAGTYAVTASFTPSDTTDYNSLTAASAGNFVIGKVTPTLSISNSPVTYTGAAQAATVTGSVGGSVSNVLYNGSATFPITAGTYAVTANFTPTDTADYNTLTAASAGNFVINKATLTLSITNSPATYTGAGQSATIVATATGITGTVAGTPGAVLYNGSATLPVAAGTYPVTANFAPTDVNDFNTVTAGSAGNFVIGKATPTLSVTNSPVTYNGNPQSATVTGSVGGTVSSVLYNGSATVPTAGGTYAITASFTPTDATDYNTLTAASAGNFIINKATPTLSVTNSPVNYTGTAQAAVVTGSVPGNVSAVLYNGSATVPIAAGTYAITASFTPTDGTDYASLTAASAGNFIINTVAPTITFVVPNHTFGDAPFVVSATSNSTGAITYSVVSGPATIAGATVTLTGAGTVVLKATQAAAGNYTTGSQNATFTVTTNTPTITWHAPASIAYGTPLSATQLDATASVGGSFTYTPVAGTILPVGAGQTLSVLFTPTDTTDYKTVTGTTTITVTASALTVSANNATRVYGTANPAFTGTVTGQQNGDTFTESFTTTATMTSNAGTYPIVPSPAGSNLADYTVVIDNGTLTITKANSTTSFSAGGASANPGASVTLTATVASATSGTPTGTVTFYDGTTMLGTGTLSGGVATYSTTTLAAGASNTLTAVYGGDVNFNGSTSASTVITVGVLDFTLGTPNPATQTGSAGTAFTYSFSISPVYANYAGTVSFAATGLPAGGVATFSPSTIAANGGPQTVTMIVNTAAGSAALVKPATPGRGLIPVALAFLLLPLAGTKRMRREGRRFGRMACLMLLVLAGLGATAAITGCGSHAGNTTNNGQSYTITITATSGAIQHTSTVTLDLQ